jgi:hypothetical protein
MAGAAGAHGALRARDRNNRRSSQARRTRRSPLRSTRHDSARQSESPCRGRVVALNFVASAITRPHPRCRLARPPRAPWLRPYAHPRGNLRLAHHFHSIPDRSERRPYDAASTLRAGEKLTLTSACPAWRRVLADYHLGLVSSADDAHRIATKGRPFADQSPLVVSYAAVTSGLDNASTRCLNPTGWRFAPTLVRSTNLSARQDEAVQ